MRIINRLLLLAYLLLPTVAFAQNNAISPAISGPSTTEIGSGYSLTNGALFVLTSASLNSLVYPFSISINVVATSVSSSGPNFLIGSNTQGSLTGGFNIQYDNSSGQSFHLQTLIQPAAAFTNCCCTHPGNLCWRFPAIEDGNRHNVCVLWTGKTAGNYLYVDGVLRDQNVGVVEGTFASSPEAFWGLGNGAPTTWTLYDARAYSSNITPGGCQTLSNLNQQGLTPSSGPLSTGMVLHLPLNNCTNSGGTFTCNDTSGNSNNATNASAPPVVAITAPAAGTISGTTNITATCTTGSTPCTSVCYYMNGILISSTCPTSSPNYTYAWDTTTVIDGSYSLTAVGTSVASLTTTSAAVAVTTSNSVTATTYNFNSSTGSDSNNCTSSACQTITKLNSLTLRGGDTVNLVGTGFTTTGSLLICGPAASAHCTQNYYPSTSTLTITGPNTCNPITGTSSTAPTGCANITRTSGTASGFQTWNVTNVVADRTLH